MRGDTEFVAYVYGGWHADPWRPGVDEWQLLDSFEPYFRGHPPPPRPVAGPYDDARRGTAERQIDEARAAGISGFTYFLYPGQDGFVLAEPLEHALSAAEEQRFSVATTWCVRLPHQFLPLEIAHAAAGMAPPATAGAWNGSPHLTVAELGALASGDPGMLDLRDYIGGSTEGE